jgi:hypothetical protein
LTGPGVWWRRACRVRRVLLALLALLELLELLALPVSRVQSLPDR